MLVVSSIGIPASAGVAAACTVTCNGNLLFEKYNSLNWPWSNCEAT